MLGKSNGLKRSIVRKFRDYCNNSSGNIATFFALSVPFVLVVIGAALDSARVTREYSTFHASVDSAAFAIAQDNRSGTMGTSISEANKLALTELAKKYITANYSADRGFSGEVSVELNITGQQINIDAGLEFPTTLMKLVGIDSVSMNASTTVEKAMRPIELVLVMDTTLSMDTGGKLAGAKVAAHQLLDTLYGGSKTAQPRNEYIRLALVPFSGAVRLDTAHPDFSLSWIDTTGANPLSRLNFASTSATYPLPATWNNYTAWGNLKRGGTNISWNGCVEARTYGATADTRYLTNDAAPTSGNPATLFPAYFNPDSTSYSSSKHDGRGNNFISGTSLTSVGSECRNLTAGQCNTAATAYTTANRTLRQESYRKYIDATVAAEGASNDGPWKWCAYTKIVPMTYNRASIETAIDAMTAAGTTNIAEGLAWGLRIISPTEPFTQVQGSGTIPGATIAPYNHERWQKIMVLMTDGDNLAWGSPSETINGSYYNAYGMAMEPNSGTPSMNRYGTTTTSPTSVLNDVINTRMGEVCTNIKADDKVTLYVTSFGTDVNLTTKALLQSCSSGIGYYQHNDSSAALAAFFNHIGEDVVNKMIYASK